METQRELIGLLGGAENGDVVTRDGRLVVLDTPLYAAIKSLRLPPAQPREDLGIAAPDAPGPHRRVGLARHHVDPPGDQAGSGQPGP